MITKETHTPKKNKLFVVFDDKCTVIMKNLKWVK
jgi:hypothetical protein